MWLVSCKRQGILTQACAPDLKCNLNISSFVTLLHFSESLIYTRSSLSIVLLLQMVGGWDRWEEVDLEQGVGGEEEGGYYLEVLLLLLLFFFHLWFCHLFSHVPCPFVLNDKSMIAVMSVPSFFIFFLCLCFL